MASHMFFFWILICSRRYFFFSTTHQSLALVSQHFSFSIYVRLIFVQNYKVKYWYPKRAPCKGTTFNTLIQSIFLHFIQRFPSWSFEDWAQFELDTLEDIFKRSDWQERALKPALSSILAPALCAVYGKHVMGR